MATFNSAVSTIEWPLADFDATLPSDWTAFEYLVVEFKATSSQRFELGLKTQQGHISKRIHPYANVWVRASIPLRFYREGLGDAAELASTVNQPRDSYWINIEAGGHGPTRAVQALTATMRYPATASHVAIRSVTLSKTDAGDAILDQGTPLIDEFGQYIHARWPGKANALADLQASWSAEEKALSAMASDESRCRFGGFTAQRRKGSGFFRVKQIEGRWWFIDPEGCRFYSAAVNGAGNPRPRTRVRGREQFFVGAVTADARGDVSFYERNLERRFGSDWQARSSQLTSRRMLTWHLNTAYGPQLNDSLAKQVELYRAYVLPLRGWQTAPGAIMGMPDVYSQEFAQRVDNDAREQLSPRKNDPWMIGYFIGNEPPWPDRESQLVDLILAGPDSAIKRKFAAAVANNDSPAARKALVHDAFREYLRIVNAAVRRHAPNHLHLGIRFGGTPPDDVIALAQGFDVYSMNKYRWSPPKDFIDRVYGLLGRPILIGEFHIGVPERGLAPGLVQAMNQPERAVAYRYYVENAAAHPAIVGTHWYQWIDQPATGRRDGENYNIGWLDVTDRPYRELIDAATLTHRRLDDIHSGRVQPTEQRARASQFGTPKDSIQLGIPAIQ